MNYLKDTRMFQNITSAIVKVYKDSNFDYSQFMDYSRTINIVMPEKA